MAWLSSDSTHSRVQRKISGRQKIDWIGASSKTRFDNFQSFRSDPESATRDKRLMRFVHKVYRWQENVAR